MKISALIFTTALSLTSCSVQDTYGVDKNSSARKPIELDINDIKSPLQAKVMCRVSGISLGQTTEIKLGRFRTMQAPSVVMRFNEKEPTTVQIIKEHKVPFEVKPYPVSGVSYIIDCKLDKKTGVVSHSGKAMVSVRNTDKDGVVSFSEGIAFWEKSTAPEKDVILNVKGHKITLHFNFTMIDATGRPIKLVDKKPL